ncbi:MAG: PDZ domain-containing protein [Burkholderiales bacterium]
MGIVVAPGQGGVVVAELRPGGRGAAAGLHQGDTIVRYNGVAVSSVREFNRLVLDTRPGRRATLEVQRSGSPRRLEVWVGQLDTMPRT